MRYHPRKSPLLSYHEDAEKALGTTLFGELADLNHAIYRLLLQRKINLRAGNSAMGSEQAVFQRLAPLSKNLTKLLHQRNAVTNFQARTLEQLLQFVANELQLAQTSSYQGILGNKDVEALPVTSGLVRELYAIVGPTATQASCRNEMLGDLAGTNFREVASAYNALVTKEKLARNTKIKDILKKVQAALSESEFEFLKGNLTPQDLARFKS